MNYETPVGVAFMVMPSLTSAQALVTGRVIDLDSKKPIKEASEIRKTATLQRARAINL